MDVKKKLTELLDNFPVQMEWHNNEELADHLIANGGTIQRWIPVTERLPDKEFWAHQERFGEKELELYNDLEVLVMIKGAEVPTTLYYNDEGEFYDFMDEDGPTSFLVTHWMPLPEPPMEG